MVKIEFDEHYFEKNKSLVQSRLHEVPINHTKLLAKNFRHASVLIPLCLYKGVPSIIFCKRSCKVKTNRSEVCFPGGMKDQTDEDLIHTAIRETYEEIGLKVSRNQIWGTFGGIVGSNFKTCATAVIADLGQFEFNQLHENREEVSFTFLRSFESFSSANKDSPSGYTEFRLNALVTDIRYKTPCYHYLHPYLPRIWGMTGIFLYDLLTLFNFNKEYWIFLI